MTIFLMVGIQVCTKYGRRVTAMGVRHHGFITAFVPDFRRCRRKKARKTGNSSRLGPLFDYGCDALTVIISACTFASTIRLKATYWVFSVLL